MSIFLNFKTLLFSTIFISFIANANIRLANIFADNMVLQRETKIPIWGFANANQKVVVSFHNQIQNTVADSNGKWLLVLEQEKAGGPFELKVEGDNTIIIKNVLVGDVWLCSGQSNMEWTVGQSDNFENEKKTADNFYIRHIKIDKNFDTSPNDDFKNGLWQNCNVETVGKFSGVAYFFAQKIYKETKIPIGLINASWGGTNIETWISREGFESSNEFKEMIAKMPKISLDSLKKISYAEKINKFEKIQDKKINQFDKITFQNSTNIDLKELYFPMLWEEQTLPDFNGVIWVQKTIDLTEEETIENAKLYLAKIDDADITYINGIEVGKTNQWDIDRVYDIPKGILKKGKNIISIQITDNQGGGGIYGDEKNFKIMLASKTISLVGNWKFQIEKIDFNTDQNSYPTLCFNAMIAPILNTSIKGVLWYQGESNASRAVQYQKAFPLLIEDWRRKFNNNFPFYFVQLATFKTTGNSNEGCGWAELREAQTKTLSVTKTAMVVTTDIGNPLDIHPTNKQEVGKRLANIALNNDYNLKNNLVSPTFESMKILSNKAIITFNVFGSKLIVKNIELIGFEIADEKGIFYNAKAKIINDNQVEVYADKIPKPTAVRFGWKGNNEDCNLFNKNSLPIVPFRTDDWKLCTEEKKYNPFLK